MIHPTKMKGYTHLIVGFISLVLPEAQTRNPNGGNSCFCLPPNQKCNPKEMVPEELVGMVMVDMIQLRTKSVCKNNRILCCFEDVGQTAPAPSITDCSSPGMPGCDPNNAIQRNLNTVNSNIDTSLCFCLPANQICNPKDRVVPDGSDTMVDMIHIRTKGAADSCEGNRVPCCFEVLDTVPESRTSGTKPNSGDCGFSSTIERGSKPGEADFGEYPWMSLIVDASNSFVATGALISPSVVITVAHNVENKENLMVRFGDYDISNGFDRDQHPVQDIRVAEIIIPPSYSLIMNKFNSVSHIVNDIAILKLARPVIYSNHINSVCRPEKNQIFDGNRCFLSGWGKKKLVGTFQSIMKEVELPIVDSPSCQALLRTSPTLTNNFILDESFICAGGEIGKDACEGDGGAPLVCITEGRAVVVGLVSWGQLCGTRIPGVYVNVAHFRDYIDSLL